MARICRTDKFSQVAQIQISKNLSNCKKPIKRRNSQKSAGTVEIEKMSQTENVSSDDRILAVT